MANELFPVFEMPEVSEETDAEEEKYKQSIYFDFEAGDFKTDGANKLIIANGQEAYRQWCMKAIMTERYDHLAYDGDIGTELEDAMKEADAEAVESAIERTITEALMVNEHTEYVRDFVFTRSDEGLICSFIVKGKDLEEQQLSMTLPT